VNCPFICCNIPAAPGYGEYISQFIRYSRAFGSYLNFLDRVLLLTRKLLTLVFLMIKMTLSPRKFYDRHHDLVNRYGICFTNDHGYVPFAASIFQFFPHSWCITGCVARVTRMVSLVEQEPLTFMSTWVHPRFLVGFQLLDRSFLCSVLEIVFCPVFVWSMCCLSFNLRILIDPLVSSNSSNHHYKAVYIDVLLFFVVLFILWLVFIFVCELLFFCI
jgi:hypothetical protein